MKETNNSLKMPVLIKISSIIWIIFGALMSIGNIFIVPEIMQGKQLSGESLVGGSVMIFMLLIAVFILYMGIQTIRAKSKDVLGNSIGVVIVAGVLIFQFILEYDYIAAFIGIILFLSGVLALASREKYKQFIENKSFETVKNNEI